MNKSRYARGVVIAAESYVRKVKGSVLWKVASESDANKRYNVVERQEGLTCDCYDFQYRGNLCKHCYAVIVTAVGRP